MCFSGKRLKRFWIILLVWAAFIPYSFQGIKIMGITLTVQRLIMPFAICWCVYLKRGKFLYSKIHYKWIIFLLSWLTWGILLMCGSSFIYVKDGLKEILSLIYAVVFFYLFSILINEREELNYCFKVMRILCIILVLLGIIEILTGSHFRNSIYFNEEAMYLKYTSKNLKINNHMATGFFYGVNDFASVLGVLFMFLFTSNRTILEKIINFIITGLLFFILVVNDANIVLLAVILGGFIYIYLKSQEKKKIYVAFGVITLVLVMIGLYNILVGNIILKEGVLFNQIENYKMGQGSLFSRITIYKDAFIAAFKNGFIGYGPASFMNYFIQYKSQSGLVNPHALVFEILFNYGGLVLLIFLGLLYIVIKKNFVAYIESREKRHLISLVSIIIYILVSFSPSSFLGYSYQWIIIELAILNITLRERKKIENEIIRENNI